METMRKYIKPTMEEYDVDAEGMLCGSGEASGGYTIPEDYGEFSEEYGDPI